MESLLELKDNRQILKDKLTQMITTAEEAQRKLDENENAQYKEIIDEIRSLDEKIKNIEDKKIEINKMEDIKRFSLIGAINDVINHRSFDETAQDVISRGIEQMKAAGQAHEGQIVLPTTIQRDVVVAGQSEHGGVAIQTDKFNILAPLYDELVLAKAGATILTGCVNDFDIPAYGGTTVFWKGEVAAAQDGAGNFTEVSFSPKRLTAYVDVSKQFLTQTSNQSEALLMSDIVTAVSQKLEATILGNGEATTTQPGGLFYNVNEDASDITFADMVDDEKTLQKNKYNLANAKWIVSPDAWAKLRTTSVDAGSGRFILEDDKIDGVGVITSGLAVENGCALADWRELLIAQWGAIDLTIDPYTQATKGTVRIVVNAYFDAKFRRSANYDVVRILKD